jgi:hypothetical protein
MNVILITMYILSMTQYFRDRVLFDRQYFLSVISINYSKDLYVYYSIYIISLVTMLQNDQPQL